MYRFYTYIMFFYIFFLLKLQKWLKPGSHCAILATIWSSETNFENPKIPIILDFDMFTDRRLMAVAILKDFSQEQWEIF